MNNSPIRIERTFNVSIETLWNAITNRDEMKNWYFDLEEFKLQVGFTFQFYGETENRKYLHLCEITEVIPGKKLTYSWKYKGYKGVSYVTFELFEIGNKTKLVLTHEGLESFAVNDNPDLTKENFIQGWEHIIGKSLVKFLEKI